mmetsp:Transcript_38793/g.62518  ORF Transcript_38793/g.62518 Transcript_38793/m.62518 type:complete len:229 (+) Transcript_38793:409-1095(+)
MCMYIYSHINLIILLYMYTYVYKSMYTYTYEYIYIFIYAHACTRTHIYTHTYTSRNDISKNRHITSTLSSSPPISSLASLHFFWFFLMTHFFLLSKAHVSTHVLSSRILLLRSTTAASAIATVVMVVTPMHCVCYHHASHETRSPAESSASARTHALVLVLLVHWLPTHRIPSLLGIATTISGSVGLTTVGRRHGRQFLSIIIGLLIPTIRNAAGNDRNDQNHWHQYT